MDCLLRRPQLLIAETGYRRAWRRVGAAATCALLFAPASCAEPDAADVRRGRWTEARTLGIDYLETTEVELGLDVVVALQIVAEQSGDARAAAVADARRATLSEEDVAELGLLLEVSKTSFDAASIRGVAAPAGAPDPARGPPEGAPDVQECLVEAVQCELTPRCIQLGIAADQWGYVLTHQAVWLLFLRWAGCEAPFDVELRRRDIGSALRAEMQFDPVMSDLAAERLAMLGHLGFVGDVEDAWIDEMLATQESSGCWRLGPGLDCHPHVTGVALWALALAFGAE